jgi:hypothetical protein
MFRLSMRSSPVRIVVDSPAEDGGAGGSTGSFLPRRENRFLKGEGGRAGFPRTPRKAAGSYNAPPTALREKP